MSSVWWKALRVRRVDSLKPRRRVGATPQRSRSISSRPGTSFSWAIRFTRNALSVPTPSSGWLESRVRRW
ncbi:hypothetical protein D3C81_2074090 [compost metagenome]